MLTVNKLVPQGRGLAPVLLKRATSVELDWDVRSKSRFDATDSAGRTLGVFLPRGQVVRGGDVLVAEDGSLVRVQRRAAAGAGGAPLPRTRLALRPAARGLSPGQPACAARAASRPPAARARPCAGRHAAPDAPDRQRGAARPSSPRPAPMRAGGTHGAHGAWARPCACKRTASGHRSRPRPCACARPRSRPRPRWPLPRARRRTAVADGAAAADVAGLAGAAGGRLQLLRGPGSRGRERPRARRGPGRRLAARPAAPEPGARRPAGAGAGPAGLAGATTWRASPR